ncbi:hypothetical protein C4K04_2387 [Pseudomonas chlororaphis]|uniref:Uncharacterized protein n=1 Tax=Pseudomonas chlororaphis TaxID=587753 RepID=A0A3G7TM25_9PSED|nr:hypothetical protein C4K04_2387 [Pseudomonas chlororaphis]
MRPLRHSLHNELHTRAVTVFQRAGLSHRVQPLTFNNIE